MNCRFCNHPLSKEFIDLVNSPASNSFLTAEQLNEPETFYPLKVYTCDKCFLVQVDEYKKSDAIFSSDYVYFSSYSKSWLAHCKAYTDLMQARFGFNSDSLIAEIASNDGYLLQYFKEKGIPVLGIEPTSNTAQIAIDKGIPTVTEFFGVALAKQLVSEGKKADLLLGNNVLSATTPPSINVCPASSTGGNTPGNAELATIAKTTSPDSRMNGRPVARSVAMIVSGIGACSMRRAPRCLRRKAMP